MRAFTTMPDSLPDYLSEHLKRLGEEIDIGRQPTVFDGGLVGTSDATESEVMKDVAGEQAGSQSGTRPGQRTRPRPRAQAPGHHFRSEALETAHGAGFRILAQHYEALAFEDRNGLWVVVSSNPLGRHGPQAQFLIAVPLDERLAPRAWAFERVSGSLQLASLKHTNFPDASICAFVSEDSAWPNPDGLLGLVDIYSLWLIRKWHRDRFGWWPGPQYGSCAFYRLKEFDAREDCGCGSNKRYGQCHLAADQLSNPTAASAEFRRLFGGDYEDRRPPESVLEAARCGWRVMPSMATVFAHRADPSRVYMI